MRIGVSIFATLSLVAFMAVVVPGAEALRDPGPAHIERTGDRAIGASIAHPAGLSVEREPYTYDGTYGYTLWRPESGEAHDHGGTPEVRVALAYDLEPSRIEVKVQETIAYYRGDELPVGQSAVSVGAEGHRGVAVGPIPGSTPSTEVYVPVNGRVYLINVYAEAPGEEGLDADDKELLSGVRFSPPNETIRSLGLPRANASEALYPSAAEARAVALHADAKAPPGAAPQASADESEEPSSSRAARGKGAERRIAEGCWRADPDFFVQTQHGYKANDARGDNIPTGWSPVGLPNFWGQYTHGNLGYGRCTKPYYTNDKFAVDYPLNKWDYVFSPFACGRVTHAGRNRTHADYGIFVSIKACNGKYVNLTGHLVAIKAGLRRGDRVTRDTVIGYAGRTGGSVPVGRVHIHTAFYRNPKANPDGSPYGGAGLQVVRNHYVGTAAKRRDMSVPRLVSSRVYQYAKIKPKKAFCREGIRCGERYKVSN